MTFKSTNFGSVELQEGLVYGASCILLIIVFSLTGSSPVVSSFFVMFLL
jgi:hypothetical protein